MAIVTATEVTVYTDISVSAGTIVTSGLIPIVQERINLITNNYFLARDMFLQEDMTFNATANTITATDSFADEGFLDGDEIYIYNSYRNDGYHIVDSVSDNVLTISSASSVIAEATTRSIYISVVEWPNALKYIAAQMVKYDYDDRKNATPGVTSKSLGPYSVSYGGQSASSNAFGYPQGLIDSLASYTAARVV
jgi:hypothetical protein